MKKLFFIATALCMGLLPQIGSAAQCDEMDNQNVIYDQAPVDPNCEYQCGPCVTDCAYTAYKPCYYYTTRCVQEPYTVKKKCRRWVPQYYEVTKCRQVPEYYKVQCCRQVPEDYCVDEVKYCTKKVRDCHCKYVPYTYHKRSCSYPEQNQPMVSNSCENTCAPQSCGYQDNRGQYQGNQGQYQSNQGQYQQNNNTAYSTSRR